MGLPDGFVMQGKPELLLEELGLDAEGIAHAVSSKLARFHITE